MKNKLFFTTAILFLSCSIQAQTTSYCSSFASSSNGCEKLSEISFNGTRLPMGQSFYNSQKSPYCDYTKKNEFFVTSTYSRSQLIAARYRKAIGGVTYPLFYDYSCPANTPVYFASWADFNKDGQFTAEERIASSEVVTGEFFETSFRVPLSTTDGLVTIRTIVSKDKVTSPCAQNYGNGQTIDNQVNISGTVPCTGGDAIVPQLLVNSNKQLVALPTGSGYSYTFKNCTTGTTVQSSSYNTFTPTVKDKYSVTVTGTFCQATSGCFDYSIICGGTTSTAKTIQAYPNPTSTRSFSLESEDPIVGFSATDVQGRTLTEWSGEPVLKKEVQLDNSASGSVLIECLKQNGEREVVRVILN